MKKIGLFILTLFAILFVGNVSQANDYEYKSLDINANILIDGTIDVNEDFTANFFVNKHGIIRDIPLNYSVEGQDFHIDVSNVYVAGKNFTESRNNGNIEIKIGDTDRTVIGEQSYPIYYSVYGLIRNFAGMGYHELYWNVVGYDFDTNINKVRIDIYLPKIYTGFTADDFLITTDGSTKTVSEFGGKVDWNKGNRITIIYDKGLPAYQGLTLAIKFPNNYFEFDHKKQSKLIGKAGNDLTSYINSNGGGGYFRKFLAIVVGIILFFCAFFKKGYGLKDEPQIRKSEIESSLSKENPIVVKYSPPEGVNCAEAGMLYNGILEPTDLTSLIYKWAVEGLISIYVYSYDSPNLDFIDGFLGSTSTRDTGFLITKLKNINDNVPRYELDFFKYLFPGEINSKKVVSKTSDFDVAFSLKELRNYGRSQGWITVGGFGFKINGSIIAIILLVVLYYFGMGSDLISFIFVIACLVSGALDSLNSDIPTQKKVLLTEKGTKLASEVIGYAKFIQACDQDKLRLFLKQDPAFFGKTLPYAVAFGFETSFIRKITPILDELDMKPSWLDGEVNDMNSISDTINDIIREREARKARERRNSTYDSDSGFSSGSSFFGGFSSGGGGGGGGSRSW